MRPMRPILGFLAVVAITGAVLWGGGSLIARDRQPNATLQKTMLDTDNTLARSGWSSEHVELLANDIVARHKLAATLDACRLANASSDACRTAHRLSEAVGRHDVAARYLELVDAVLDLSAARAASADRRKEAP